MTNLELRGNRVRRLIEALKCLGTNGGGRWPVVYRFYVERENGAWIGYVKKQVMRGQPPSPRPVDWFRAHPTLEATADAMLAVAEESEPDSRTINRWEPI